MALSSTFSFQKKNNGDSLHFVLAGSIDANADSVLQTLTGQVTANSDVLLDFSQVGRVNSMGLSLLLQVFEEWERQRVRIQVQNLDRMVSMLFKITGLGRFIKADGNNVEVTGAVPNAAGASRDAAVKAATGPVAHDKLNFVANLQSGQQLTGWYLLNTYLQRRLKKAIHFEQATDAVKAGTTDLLFARPFEACHMMAAHGFIPMMRPVHEADEVVILTRSDDTRALSDYAGTTVATASQNSFVYLLGRFLCDDQGLDSGHLTFDFCGNEIKALQSLLREKCELLFMLKKTYDGLSSFSRNSIRKLDESQTDFAYHLFCVSPYLKDSLENSDTLLTTVLTGMTEDEQGKAILREIQINGWVKPEQGELKMLEMVYNRYLS